VIGYLTSIQAHVCRFDSYHGLIDNSAGLRLCAETLATRCVIDGRVMPQPINSRFKLASTDCEREQDRTLLSTEESLELTFAADSSSE
jgi:hypothetical protein